MTVIVTECNGMKAGLFFDLAMYSNVNKWLEAMRDGKDVMRALDVFVVYNVKSHRFKSGGTLSADADKIIRAVAKLPSELQTIPNDWMRVKADMFESELLIVMEY